MTEERSHLFAVIENRYADYAVYDDTGGRIGKDYDLFVDENGNLEYLDVKMGSLGLRARLIPVDDAPVNERWQLVEASESKERVKDATSFDDKETTPEFDWQVRSFFGAVSDEALEVLSTEWIVPFLLVCLQERDCRGHELMRKMVDLGLGATRSAAMYRALRQMEKEGTIVSEPDRFDRNPFQRKYSITEFGEAYLEYLANAFAKYRKEMLLFFRIYNRQHTPESYDRSTRTLG